MSKRIIARHELPKSVDPATHRYIDQLLGKEPAFSAESPVPAQTPQQKFLDAYVSNGGITKSALKAAGVSRDTFIEWKTNDPEFKKGFEEVQTHWVEELRKTAFLRAQAKSDVLLMFLLKALQPDVFDEDVRKQQYVGLNNSKDAIPVRATLVRDNTINFNISKEQADEIREIITIESAEGPKEPPEDF